MQTNALGNVVWFLNHVCNCVWMFITVQNTLPHATQTTASKLQRRINLSLIQSQEKWNIIMGGIFLYVYNCLLDFSTQ